MTTIHTLQNTEVDADDSLTCGPRWPQGRNVREEQLANAAEARLLSIVSQVNTGHGEASSPHQTACQVGLAHAQYSGVMCGCIKVFDSEKLVLQLLSPSTLMPTRTRLERLISQLLACCTTCERTSQTVYGGDVFCICCADHTCSYCQGWHNLACVGCMDAMCRAYGCMSMSCTTECSVNLVMQVSSARQTHVPACRGQSNSIEVQVWQ